MGKNERNNRPVVAASFLYPNEAHVFRGLLASEGIESFIFHERSTMYTPVSIGGVQVAVRERDLEKARALLREVKKGKSGF